MCGMSPEFPACWNPIHRCQICNKGKKNPKHHGLCSCRYDYVKMHSLSALRLTLLLIFPWVYLWYKQGTKGGMTGTGHELGLIQLPFPRPPQRSCSSLLHFVVPEKHHLFRKVIHFVASPF